ncbi:MAG: hypothetical protein WA021_03830 [Minisyncoccia bacterium]
MSVYNFPFSKKIFLLLCSIVLIFVLIGIEARTDAAPDPEAHWRERIATVGAEKAYAELVDELHDATQQQQHVSAHYFGGALYTEAGIDALPICDERFSYGCFHQFIGTAIHEKGLKVVNTLRDTCARVLGGSAGACIHSVGHGILTSIGYSEDALREALKLCRDVPNATNHHPISECERGVLMEFNFRAMLGEEAETRPVTDTGWNNPCDRLDGSAQITCFYTNSQWWRALEARDGGDNTAVIARVGARCADVPPAFRDVCFSGLGATIAWDFDDPPSEKATLCDSASSDARSQASCRAHLAYWLSKIVRTEPFDRKYAPDVACEGLAEKFVTQCRVYASGQAIPL